MITISFLDKLNLTGDPFYPQPVGDSDNDTRGFINRQGELTQLYRYIEKRHGFIAYAGNIGVGKSSMLKRGAHYAKKKKIVVFPINVGTYSTPEEFLNQLIRQVRTAIQVGDIPVNDELMYRVVERLKLIDIDGEKETLAETENSDASIQANAKLINAKIGIEDGTLKRKETASYVPTRLCRIYSLMSDLTSIFDNVSCMIVADDLDKEDGDNLTDFLIGVVKKLPRNILFLTSVSEHHMRKSDTATALDMTFDSVKYLEKPNTIAKLQMFVDGRILNHSKNSDQILFFGKKIYEVLLNRTGGNLREVFRYLGEWLTTSSIPSPDIGGKIHILNDRVMVSIIKSFDKAKSMNLTDGDYLLLETLLSCFGGADHDTIRKMSGWVGKADSIRKKLNELCQKNWVFRTVGNTGGRGNKTLYSAPSVLKYTLDLVPLSEKKNKPINNGLKLVNAINK